MWTIELTTKTKTADRITGIHRAVMETIFPSWKMRRRILESASGR
jgi:hypothetical protein